MDTGWNLIGRCNSSVRRVPDWVLYVAAVAYVLWLFWLGLTGGLGPEPIKELEHRYGMAGLWALIAGLSVTPLRKWLGINLISWRRAIGLITFLFISCHFLVWLVLDVQMWSMIGKDIVKRPYITLGFLAWLAMLPLALTSNNYSVRKLGAMRWRTLHKLTYAVALCGCLHYLMQVRGFQINAVIYAGLILMLLLARIDVRRFTRR